MKHAAPDLALLERWREDRTINFELRGYQLALSSTWGLFSPERIDDGSLLLLEHTEVAEDEHILDLGCGYGILGLHLGQRAHRGRVLMVDKDFVAVEYARKNIALNGLSHIEAQLSNGLQHIEPVRTFDLIVCNLPAKASKEQHYLFLNDCKNHLNTDGRLVIVAITGLRQFIARTSSEIFGNYEKVKQSTTYTVSCTRKMKLV